MKVVGSAVSLEELATKSTDLAPDVIVADLPEVETEELRSILRDVPGAVVLTDSTDGSWLTDSLVSGSTETPRPIKYRAPSRLSLVGWWL